MVRPEQPFCRFVCMHVVATNSVLGTRIWFDVCRWFVRSFVRLSMLCVCIQLRLQCTVVHHHGTAPRQNTDAREWGWDSVPACVPWPYYIPTIYRFCCWCALCGGGSIPYAHRPTIANGTHSVVLLYNMLGEGYTHAAIWFGLVWHSPWQMDGWWLKLNRGVGWNV